MGVVTEGAMCITVRVPEKPKSLKEITIKDPIFISAINVTSIYKILKIAILPPPRVQSARIGKILVSFEKTCRLS
jgi:hypothetical protein